MKFNKRALLLIIFIQLILITDVLAQDSTQTKKRMGHFELSFGQSLLFISSSDQVDLLTKSAIVVPTSSILLFAEFRTLNKIKIPVFCNIPVSAKQFIINNQIINEQASASYGTGVQFRIFNFEVLSKSIMEMELGPMLSLGNDQKGNMWAAPFLASRIRIRKGENFVMYIGATYAFGVNTSGLIYGTGTIF
jgi:hypothetical protein